MNVKPKNILTSNRGQSIVQELVALSIALVVIGGVASLIASQQRESRAISEKVTALDMQANLTASFANSPLCSFEVTDASQTGNRSAQTFDSTKMSTKNPPRISFKKLHSSADSSSAVLAQTGLAPSASQKNMVVESIELTNFTSTGVADQYIADFSISFDNSKLVRTIRPIVNRVVVLTDPTSPASAKKITSCRQPEPPPSTISCPAITVSCTATSAPYPLPSASDGDVLNVSVCNNGVLSVLTDTSYSVQPRCDKGIWKDTECKVVEEVSLRNCERNFTGEPVADGLTFADTGSVQRWSYTGHGSFAPDVCRGGTIEWGLGANKCSAQVPDNTFSEGYILSVVNKKPGMIGYAGFNCTGGKWTHGLINGLLTSCLPTGP